MVSEGPKARAVPEGEKDPLETIENLDWSKSLQYVLKSFPQKIFHVLWTNRRIRYRGKVVPPGYVIVVPEGQFSSKTPDVYDPVEFHEKFRPVEAKDAETPLPEDELEKYEPEISELQKEDLAWTFTYHKPDAAQQENLIKIRAAGRHFAAVMLGCTPKCADQSASLRKIREAVMTANAAVVLEKKDTGG